MNQPGFRWRKRIVSLVLWLVIASCLVLFFNINTSATSRLQLLWRQARGISSTAVPTGRGSGGAGRGPICVLAEAETESGARSVVALVPVIEAESSQSLTSDNIDSLSNPETELSESLTTNDSEFIAIPPAPTQGYVGGYTVAEQPIFWFYVPYVASNILGQTNSEATDEADSIRVGKFVLLDRDKNFISSHLMAIQLLQSPQLVTFQVPSFLELNQFYNWYFSIICEPEKPSRNPVVRGWIERIEPSSELANALQNSPPFQKHLIYAENGIWFEALSELVASLRRFSPLIQPQREQIQQDWTDFLASINILNPETLDLSITEPVQIKADLHHQSQLPARM